MQSWYWSHAQESVLDEGAYLLKGWFAVLGEYRLYQDFGFWSNHMPLAFLIPGWLQALFGPGLRTGRFFAVLLGALMLLGLWLTVRRLRGRWWAAAVLLAVTVNPAMIKMYSTAVSQVLIACLFVWTLFFLLGEGRKMWQIAAGGILAAVMVLIRINLVPVLGLFVLYVFWQHGKRAGLLALAASGLPFILGHALFWPNILRMWAYWLPASVTPFLNDFRPPPGAARLWDPDIALSGRIASFFHSVRYNYMAMVGVLAAWLLWPRKEQWKDRSDFRSAVLLSAMFLTLLLVHMWATLLKNYCVYCLAGYVTFFASAGLILVALTFSIWLREVSRPRQALIGIAILALSAGIGYGAFEDIGNPLLSLPVPGLLTSQADQALVPLRTLLLERLPFEQRELRRLVPAVFGFAGGILLLGVVSPAVSRLRNRKLSSSLASQALVVMLAGGMFLSPTILLGGGYKTYDCSGDVIASFEAAGRHLAENIPAGSRVYWKGGLSVAPLLYMPDVKIYPPQVNGDYSYYLAGDTDLLHKYGFWNDELARQWANDADYILIQERYYEGWLKDHVNSGGFDELPPTPATLPCRADSPIHIFRRLP
jgi:hypothetical protein